MNSQLPEVVGMVEVDPRQFVARATALAGELAEVINRQHLYAVIQNRKYLTVEALTLLASMLGVHPIVEWTKALDEGWEARVVVHNHQGMVIGAGEAMCTREEKTWRDRDEFALRAMAQTRATSRALRGPLGFVVKLAGYEATGAEEMPQQRAQRAQQGAEGDRSEGSAG